LTLLRRFIREFKDVCLQEGENGNKTFWDAVKSLGRSVSLISKPEAQAAVSARLRIGQITGLSLLLGQGGKSRVAEATAVKVDTTSLHPRNVLMIMPSSFKINRTSTACQTLYSSLIYVFFVVIVILNRLIVFPTILQASLIDHHVPVRQQAPPALEPLAQQVHLSSLSLVDQPGPA